MNSTTHFRYPTWFSAVFSALFILTILPLPDAAAAHQGTDVFFDDARKPFHTSVTADVRTDLRGQVLDADTGLPLIGANVFLEGTTVGASTDTEGEFLIPNLEDGTYALVIRYIGYVQQTIPVTLADGAYDPIVVQLKPEALTGDDVVVYGQALGQVRAINQQRESDAIVNVVSEEKLRELPDVNAAEAIGRLPGIALQRNNGEGQKVIIRGLEPKFTNITINGVKVPSNSGSNKSVDLSMISSEVLAGIEVYKSPTPDMDADAIGGTVNLVLREAPNRDVTSVKLEGAYNGLKADLGNYKSSVNLSRRLFADRLGLIFQGSFEGINRSSNEFGGGYEILEDITPTGFNLRDQIEFRTRNSLNLNLDYRLPNGKLALYSYYAQTGRDSQVRRENYQPIETNIVQYSISAFERDIQLFSNMLSGEHQLNGMRFDWSGSYARTESETPNSYYMLFEDIEAYSHDPILDASIPLAAWVDSARTDINRSRLRNGYLSRSNQFEDNYTLLGNMEIPLTSGLVNSTFKAGLKQQSMSRELENTGLAETFYYLGGLEMKSAIELWESSNDKLAMTPDGRISLTNFVAPDPFKIGTFLDGDFTMRNPLDVDRVKRWFGVQEEILNPDRYELEGNYQYSEQVTAAYAMVKLNVGSWFRLISGVRIEDTYNDMTAKYSRLQERYGQEGTIQDTSRTKTYQEVMPHLHLRLVPTDWFDVRLSYAQTLARPDYNMVIPKGNINAERARITAGNPDLKHMTAENYDITATLFSSRLGLLSFSYFYKDLKNIFFPVQGLYLASDSVAASWGFPTRAGYDLTSYDNSPEAKVQGYEIDLQTNLSSLDSFLRGVVVSANLTKQFSETTKYNFATKDSLIGIVRGRPVFETLVVKTSRQIDIPGQTPLIFNLSLGYDYKGFSGRVSGNYQSEYLVVPGQSEVRDVSNGEFWRWDVALKQKINDNLTANFSISNLTGMREETYRNFNPRYPGSISHYGAITNFGIQWRW